MADSPNLVMPYLEAAQAQKHVTHNDALVVLDALVQLSVLSSAETEPPGSFTDGDRYIVASGGTGDWAGWDNHVAAYQDGAWVEYTPLVGWVAWDQAADQLLTFDGSSWNVYPSTIQNLSLLGVNATADATNKLAVASEYTLFNNIGDNVYLKLNKAATGDTASTLYQNNWSGRAEVGIVGNDDFSFKVSADGSTWYTGITLVVAAKGVHKVQTFTVANLPAAGTAAAGAKAMVTDANATTFASVVAGGGASTVPVYSDGTNWRIG